MAFLKQLVVTLVVLALAGAAYIKLDPAAGRALLNADLNLPKPLREIVLLIAPEAGEPAPEVAEGRGHHGFGGGGTVVTAGTVTQAETRTRMKAIGTGDAARSVTVHPDNTGIIESVEVQSGDEVAAGAVMASLERSSEELAVRRARLMLDSAEDQFDRQQRLRSSNAASSVAVTDAQRTRDNAALDLRSAEIALGKRDIRAPIDGRVGIVPIEVGDLVNEQSTIATVDDRSRIKLVFYAPESFVPDLKVGERVSAVPTSRPGESYDGEITALDNRLDEASRTLRTEAMIDNRSDDLRPGMSFAVSIALPGETYFAVDPLSVVWERDGPIVWKIVDGKTVKAPVSIVERTVDRMLVASDALRAGDRFVVEGIQSVREGGTVEIENAEGSAETGEDPAKRDDEEVDRDVAPAAQAEDTSGSRTASTGFGVGSAVAAERSEGKPPAKTAP